MAYTQVILKEKIANLGAEADVVKVRRGFARNFLLPQGKAMEATKRNLAFTASLKAIRAKREVEEVAEAEKLAAKIKKIKLTMTLSTGSQGKAFGSITTLDIAKALEVQHGLKLDRHTILLDKPIKATGKHDVNVKIHADVTCFIKLNVTAEGSNESFDDEGGEG
jgi:large subunit ribosomal protein L9